MADIDNRSDIIDSRDIIARIEELESERESLQDDVTEAQGALDSLEEDGDADTGEAKANLFNGTEALSDWDKSEDAAEQLRTSKLTI